MSRRILVEGIVFLPDYITREGRDLKYYVHKIIEKRITFPRGDFTYVLCKPLPRTGPTTNEEVLFAEMLKMSKSTKEQYFNEESWLPIEEERMERHIRTYSRFILYPDGRIILEDARPHLSRKTFADMLENLLHEAIRDEEAVFRVQINFKKSKVEIHQFIERCSAIRAVRFSGMRAPNPWDFGDEKINKARDLIKRTNSRTLLFQNQQGLAVDSDEIAGGLGMVQSGVGDAKITGTVKEGQTEVLETRKKVRTKHMDIEDDDDFIAKADEFTED